MVFGGEADHGSALEWTVKVGLDQTMLSAKVQTYALQESVSDVFI